MRKSITTHVKGLPIKKRTKAEEKVVPETSGTKPVEAEPEVIAVETSTAKVEPEKKPRKARQSKGLVMKKTV